jgi:nucleoside-diphosphate-sugar epimerase
MRHAVVTGAAGFIGSHLAERLLGQGWRVTGVDSLLTGSVDNVAHLGAGFELVEADVSVGIPTVPAFDALFHLASPASPVHYTRHPVATLRAGSLGTLNALDRAAEHGAVLVLASTSEVYGDPLEHPQTEAYRGNVDPAGPRAMYDEAKRFAEAAVATYARGGTVDGRIARIFNTYGPRMAVDDGRVIPNFIAAALAGEPLAVYGDGSQTRSLCWVGDLVDGLIRLAEAPGVTGLPVNLGNPEEVTMAQLARIVIEEAGSTSTVVSGPLPPDDPRRRRPDIERARTLLGWEPRVPLREGLRMTLAAARERA